MVGEGGFRDQGFMFVGLAVGGSLHRIPATGSVSQPAPIEGGLGSGFWC